MVYFWNGRYDPTSEVESTQIDKRIEFRVVHEQQEKPSNRLLISSLLGSIGTFIWEGFLYKDGKPEKAKQVKFTFVCIQFIHLIPVMRIDITLYDYTYMNILTPTQMMIINTSINFFRLKHSQPFIMGQS